MIKPGQTGDPSDFIPIYTAGESIAADDWLAFDQSDNKVYKASASAVSYRLNVIGVALTSATANNPVSVNTQPIVTGTYTANTKYYLSNTQGLIGTSAGTVSRLVGFAVSTTKLIRPKNGALVSDPIAISSGTQYVSGVVNAYINNTTVTVNSVTITQVPNNGNPSPVSWMVKAGDSTSHGGVIRITDQ